MSKEIDYLFEDPVIRNQEYALVSIVGPNMKQKCSVWGLKVRGTCDSIENAKKLSAKLNKIDPDYDIYTVETGKFFPLVVDPDAKMDVEYSNQELNSLVKGYIKNKQEADDVWLEEKNKKVKEAIREGKEGVKRTPLIVLNTIKSLTQNIESSDANIEALIKAREQMKDSLKDYQDSFEKFSDSEKEEAIKTIAENEKKENENNNNSSSSSK